LRQPSCSSWCAPAYSCTCTLPLHDALPISLSSSSRQCPEAFRRASTSAALTEPPVPPSLCSSDATRLFGPSGGNDSPAAKGEGRSEEHTSELQSREKLVCRLLLEKKKVYTL